MSQDNRLAAPDITQDQDGAAPDKDNAAPFLVVKGEDGKPIKSFQTEGDVVKSLAEAQAALTKSKQELAENQRQLAQNDAISKLTDAATALAPRGPTDAERSEAYDRLIEECDGDTRKTLDVVHDGFRVIKEEYAANLDKAQKEQQTSHDKEMDELRKLVMNQDPDYLANRDQIDKAVADYGVTRDVAKQMVSDYAQQYNAGALDVDKPPASIGGGLPGAIEQSYLSADEESGFRARGATDKMIQDMKDSAKDRIQRAAIKAKEEELLAV